ncbi:hypothetical protein DSO57_1011531 [Entomophthora muscae]|uniref:Uncharacterized protein n=1 Tax=Entomophthora muscae TaxID=34485 RepID=A0ACC2T6N0_9FUNG|nr:hypothetical protein DSO57_1011531 [Entomophthora muscae]
MARVHLSAKGASKTLIDQLALAEGQKQPNWAAGLYVMGVDGICQPIFSTVGQDLCSLIKCSDWLADGTCSDCLGLLNLCWSIHEQQQLFLCPGFYSHPEKVWDTHTQAWIFLKGKLGEIFLTIEEQAKEARKYKGKAPCGESDLPTLPRGRKKLAMPTWQDILSWPGQGSNQAARGLLGYCVLRRSTDTQQGILTLGLDLY